MALELKDLSTYRFIQSLKNGSELDKILVGYLEAARVLNYLDLYEYTYERTLNNHSLDSDAGISMVCYTYYASILYREINFANSFLEKYNARDRKSRISLFPTSEDGIPLTVRTNTDWQNKVIRLDCFAPLMKGVDCLNYSTFNTPIEDMFCGFSIAELRTLLSTLDTNSGRNALVSNFSGVGSSKIEKYSGSILRYDDQLDRLFKEMKTAGDSCDNVFDYKRCEREQIISEYLQEIYIYLLSRTSDFVFGNVSDDKYRKIMIRTDSNYRGKQRDPLLELICNCLTLGEINGFMDSKRLDIHDGIGPVLVRRLTKESKKM